ncbi:MAG: tail fiber domain-containing protein [Bacteroidales bacterium]|jgi:hypothetical protein|nr:tail fiber domain-containing protein [Bacteroidales bacterium]
MKTKLSLLFLVSCFFCLVSLQAQIPQGFNYQAVARNASGLPIINQALPIRMTIQSDSLGGTIFWQELHSSVITTDQGVINLVIGKGARQSLSTVAAFSAIDWGVSPKFLKIEIDYSGWKTLGVSRLWSVPYAMVAEDLVGTVKKLSVKGETSGLEEALFEVKNKDGQTVFAVYNEGVRVYVSDGAKAVKGGFAVGGFGTDKAESTKYLFVGKDSVRIYLDTNPLTKKLKGGFAIGGYDLTKGTVQDYLDVNADSVRIYIDSDPSSKKIKGGFAVGGYDMTKAPQEEYLRVTRDSTRVYVNNNPAKAVKGGFAVGGFDITKGIQTVTPFTSLTPQNYFIGQKSGIKTTTGIHNSFVGYETGINNTTGQKNVFLGYHSGMSNESASYNVFIGNEAGINNITGNYNTFMGFQSGYSNNTDYNSFIGYQAGKATTTGSNNSFMGYRAGFSNTQGTANVFIGTESGGLNTTGNSNVLIGNQSGAKNLNGSRNIFIGEYAGNGNTSGKDNIYLGTRAGVNCKTGVINVFIGNMAGLSNEKGVGNVGIGYEAGYNLIRGWRNVFLGSMTGGHCKTGDDNVFLGTMAGGYLKGGIKNVIIGGYAGLGNYSSTPADTLNNENVIIGFSAGNEITNQSGNVFIGAHSGEWETGSDKLYIDNSNTSNPLIWGDFASNLLRFNGKVGIGTNPTTKFAIAGLAGSATGSTLIINGNDVYYLTSLKDSKKDIETLTDNFDKILKANPVSFTDKSTGVRGIGYIAEEFEQEGLQNLLVYDGGKLVSLRYDLISVYSLEVIKEQQNAIQEQQAQIESYKSHLQSLQEKVDKIEALLAKTLDE